MLNKKLIVLLGTFALLPTVDASAMFGRRYVGNALRYGATAMRRFCTRARNTNLPVEVKMPVVAARSKVKQVVSKQPVKRNVRRWALFGGLGAATAGTAGVAFYNRDKITNWFKPVAKQAPVVVVKPVEKKLVPVIPVVVEPKETEKEDLIKSLRAEKAAIEKQEAKVQRAANTVDTSKLGWFDWLFYRHTVNPVVQAELDYLGNKRERVECQLTVAREQEAIKTENARIDVFSQESRHQTEAFVALMQKCKSIRRCSQERLWQRSDALASANDEIVAATLTAHANVETAHKNIAKLEQHIWELTQEIKSYEINNS